MRPELTGIANMVSSNGPSWLAWQICSRLRPGCPKVAGFFFAPTRLSESHRIFSYDDDDNEEDDDDHDDDDDDHDENIFEEFLAVRMDLTKIFLKGF